MLTTAFRTSTVWPDAGVKISPILQKSSLKVPTVNFFKIAKKIKILVNFCNNFCHPDVSKLAQSGHTLHGLATHTHPSTPPWYTEFPGINFRFVSALTKSFFSKRIFQASCGAVVISWQNIWLHRRPDTWWRQLLLLNLDRL